jgi:hypothetical protein
MPNFRPLIFILYVNVKKTIALFSLGALAFASAACGGDNATPTRTRVAEAQETQTPWVIYIPVTVTPGPSTPTLEATATPNAPQPTSPPPTKPRPTSGPRPTSQPKSPTVPPEPATPAPPTATPAPSCGQAFQVTKLTFPANGDERTAKAGSGAGKTIQFQWEPIAGYELDPHIGYRVNISTPINSQALYISHNNYLQERMAILSQQATYGLTNGDDITATWTVDVIRASGEFNDAGDDTQPPLGTVAVCGPTSPAFVIHLVVQ